jgi:hypothetical protein
MEMRDDFDALARELAQGLSRREALRRVCGGFAGAILASLGAGRAWGAPNPCASYCNSLRHPAQRKNCNNACKQCGDNVQNVCPALDSDKVACCNQGTGCCSGACTPLGTAQNCRGCGDTCPGVTVCVSAMAGCQCPSGTALCGTTCCANTCCNGACCNAGEACLNGACTAASTCSGDACTGTLVICGSSGECSCYAIAEGGNLCLSGGVAQPQSCTTSADCPAGYACAKGGPVCAQNGLSGSFCLPTGC